MADFVIGDYKYDTWNVPGSYTVKAVVVDKDKSSYSSIPSTVTYNGVTYTVVSLDGCFGQCIKLVSPPAIPSTVTDIQGCFYKCEKLTSAPTIPNGVTVMDNCFSRCSSLVTPPNIPNGVTTMSSCFLECTKLASAPTLPSSVTNLNGCFQYCTSLTTAPTIPSSVIKMNSCFSFCYALTAAPAIPGNVTEMNECFRECRSLEGSISIAAQSPSTTFTFWKTVNDIFITLSGQASAEHWRNVASEYDNVYPLFDHTPPSINFTVTRCDSSGAEDDLGEYAYVYAKVYANDTSVPQYSTRIESTALKIDGVTVTPEWHEEAVIGAGGSDRLFEWAIISLGDLGIHAFAMTATDNYGFTCAPITVSIPSANPALDFTHDDATGLNGVSVGKPATVAGLLDVGMDLNVDGDIKNNGTRVMPVFAVASWSTSSDESTLPATPCIVLSLSDMGLYHCTG